ncbi:hypothetical protein EDD11_001938 [Mortierella claussenii]|nr:hypothetical protein EDD11_001938 [Mortierella claussenii]
MLSHDNSTSSQDTSISTNDDATVSKEYKADLGHTSDSSDDNNASKANVFAGVVIFSVGMLVLILAMAFYFVNGRSWKTLRGRNKKRAQLLDGTVKESLPEPGTDTEVGSGVGSEDAVGDRELDMMIIPVSDKYIHLDQEADCNSEQTDMAAVPEQQYHRDMQRGLVEAALESSPSTVRLDDIMHTPRSVFSLIKGTIATTGSSSRRQSLIITGAGNSAIDMPLLTRTRARSSIRYKPSGVAFCRGSFLKLRHHNKISVKSNPDITTANIQHPEPVRDGAPLADNDYDCRDTLPASALTPVRSVQRAPSASTYLHIDTPQQQNTNASVIALYGSARSSPDEQMADTASIQALYCSSLHSAVSYSTLPEIPSRDLDTHERKGQKVVLDMGEYPNE